MNLPNIDRKTVYYFVATICVILFLIGINVLVKRYYSPIDGTAAFQLSFKITFFAIIALFFVRFILKKIMHTEPQQHFIFSFVIFLPVSIIVFLTIDNGLTFLNGYFDVSEPKKYHVRLDEKIKSSTKKKTDHYFILSAQKCPCLFTEKSKKIFVSQANFQKYRKAENLSILAYQGFLGTKWSSNSEIFSRR